MNDLDFLQDFDPKAASEEAGGGFDVIPVGVYQAIVDEASIEPTRDQNGRQVAVTLVIQGPTHAGRKVWDRMLVAHRSQADNYVTAVGIARGKFGDLCLACGFNQKPNDTRELIGKAVSVKVGIERDKSGQYEDKNIAKAYAAPKGAPGAGATGASAGFKDDDIPF